MLKIGSDALVCKTGNISIHEPPLVSTALLYWQSENILLTSYTKLH